MHVLAWNPIKKNTQHQPADLPEAATAMHRSKANRATWPSISGKFKFEVLVEAGSGSLGCEGTQAQWLKCPCLAAEQQWLWQRGEQTIPVFKDRKGQGKKKPAINEEVWWLIRMWISCRSPTLSAYNVKTSIVCKFISCYARLCHEKVNTNIFSDAD